MAARTGPGSGKPCQGPQRGIGRRIPRAPPAPWPTLRTGQGEDNTGLSALCSLCPSPRARAEPSPPPPVCGCAASKGRLVGLDRLTSAHGFWLQEGGTGDTQEARHFQSNRLASQGRGNCGECGAFSTAEGKLPHSDLGSPARRVREHALRFSATYWERPLRAAIRMCTPETA